MKPLLAPILLSLIVSALSTEILLYSTNTLKVQNGDWRVSKNEVNMLVMGAQANITRSTIAGNKLDLGSWFGFQEFYTGKEFNFRQVTFNYNISDKTFISVAIGARERSGFLISNNPEFPSCFFTADKDGKFLTKVAIDLSPANTKWHQARLLFEDSTMTLTTDNKTFKFEIGPALKSSLYFRGDSLPAYIDDVNINDGEFRSSFTNRNYYWKLLGSNLLVCALFLIILFLQNVYRKKSLTRFALETSFALLFIIFFQASYYVFDFYYWSNTNYDNFSTGRMPSETKSLNLSNFESLRLKTVAAWHNFLITPPPSHRVVKIGRGPILCDRELECFYDADLANNLKATQRAFKILFIGQSQTVGSGASTLEKTFVAQIHKKLIKKLKTDRLATLNLAISGATAGFVIDNYLNNFQRFNPDVIILNVGNNDIAGTLFKSVNDFVSKFADRSKRFILLHEPRLDRTGHNSNDQRLKVISEIGESQNIPVIKFHHYMNSDPVKNSGFLWWDKFHLTDAGQSIAADFLTDEIYNRISWRFKK